MIPYIGHSPRGGEDTQGLYIRDVQALAGEGHFPIAVEHPVLPRAFHLIVEPLSQSAVEVQICPVAVNIHIPQKEACREGLLQEWNASG